jgi:tetratricopeptide (TPR) repeat protein
VILSALVDFHTEMRAWPDAIAAIETFLVAPQTTSTDRVSALMRRAELHADGEMDAQKAITVLREVLRLDPSHQDAYYQLAQQYFLVERYGDARAAIERVIELATAPGQPLSPSALARYYYYRGRILDASGDQRAAAPQYRRATEYDPGYAPPALVLARRASDAKDQRTAETLLIDAAHAAMERGGPPAAVPLQRGLARMLLASGDRAAAIEAYRGILNVDPDSASDRVALAEIYAVDDPQRAVGELRKVLERDIHHAPAYRLLATYYNRLNDTERATRVLTALDLLGFAEEVDRVTSRRMRATRQTRPLRRALDDKNRERYLMTSEARSAMGEVFSAFAEEISTAIPSPALGINIQPALAAGETRLVQIAAEVSSLFDVDAEIYVGEQVPGLAAVTAYPRKLVVLDRALVSEDDAPLRFLFGYAFEAIRGGYASLLTIGSRQRRELSQLMLQLLNPETQNTGLAGDMVGNASETIQTLLERVSTPDTQDLDPSGWIDGMLANAKRAGLVACDDFAPAIWMVARLSGETLASHDATVALGAVLGGPDLVRFYLSDDYQHLRDVLTVGAA